MIVSVGRGLGPAASKRLMAEIKKSKPPRKRRKNRFFNTNYCSICGKETGAAHLCNACAEFIRKKMTEDL